MEVRSFNCELGTSNILFKRLFGNIKIEKVNSDGTKQDIVVNCQFGQRSRILKSWQNSERKAMMKLPMIVINRTGYSRDSSRVNNLHNEVKYEITSKDRRYDCLTPVPVDISYEVTVISKWQRDIDQIASNFMVFFNSSLYVSCVHPKYDGIKMNNQVIMEDSVTEDHPDEIDGSTDDFITSTFNFTFKTFLFGGMAQAKKRRPKKPVTQISTFIEDAIVEIPAAGIDEFQKRHPDLAVSAMLTAEVTKEVTSYIDNPDISDDVYEEFAPIINQINVGFYPVPRLSNILQHIENVNQYEHEFYDISGYISSTGYLSGFETYVDSKGNTRQRLSSLTPSDMIYDRVDSNDTIYPYVDKLIWKIDGSSPNQFPMNIYPFRDNR